jgi:hypothetical protein
VLTSNHGTCAEYINSVSNSSELLLSVKRLLLHNDGFCNGYSTKRCLHNSKMGHIMIFHDCTMVKDESNKKCNVFCLFLKNIGYLRKGDLVRIKAVFWCIYNP